MATAVMIPGLRGSLLSHDALDAAPDVIDRTAAHRRLADWHEQVRIEGGPVWPARVVFDRVAVPFCRLLGFEVIPAGGEARWCRALLHREGNVAATMSAFAWGQDPGTTWRESVRGGIAAGSRWCYCFAGPTLRVYDAQRTHSRRFAEFDLAILSSHPAAFGLAWSLLADPLALDEAVRRSERHRASVRDALQLGVQDALGHLTRAFAAAYRPSAAARRSRAVDLLDESLVVIYRVLFLLFAEARGLVPSWHPVFRDGYTIESLRPSVETQPRPRGVWEALQAIARLAHRGCRAGSLRVPPFNGRLFSPSDAPLADSIPLDDGAVRHALMALTTRPTAHGRQRIAYGDLGVEQLGGVYERVLDYEMAPARDRSAPLVRSGRRKATGTFYTPRSVTEYLVRRTLAPLAEDAEPEAILGLRVLDPAMGSGAFLVAACRYLASAYEAALLREGSVAGSDLSEAERAGFRRIVAQRCLFGVDLNPMSVQLARLSLWLTTLSGSRPLTFFDHHLRTGNSLVGAGVADVRLRRSGGRAASGPLPLLDALPLEEIVGAAVTSRESLRDGLEDTIEQIRGKERLFAELQSAGAPLSRWRAIADLWCAGWFDHRCRGVSRGTFEALIDTALGRGTSLPETVIRDLLRAGREAAEAGRFFHWELEFPEVFHGADGAPLARPGFDAILGNPPWEMLRGDAGDAAVRKQAAGAGSALTRFVRDSGIYRLQGTGHANLYQMFVERALGLLRRDGRLGIVVPWGFASDHGSAALRRHILRATSIDSFVVVDNVEALFPIHRGLKFVLLTISNSRPQPAAGVTLPVRSGLRSAAEFDRLPDAGEDPQAVPVSIRLIEELSGDQLAVPDLRTPLDVRIAAQIAAAARPAGDPAGWNLRFGRELNATDDRAHFNQAGRGLPVIEGKQVQPFAVDVDASRHHIQAGAVARVLGRRPFEQPRLVYRDVAAASNRLTLIAAVLPAGTITTHTLFCLNTPLDDDAPAFRRRNVQQLRRQLHGAAASHHARDRGDHRAAATAKAGPDVERVRRRGRACPRTCRRSRQCRAARPAPRPGRPAVRSRCCSLYARARHLSARRCAAAGGIDGGVYPYGIVIAIRADLRFRHRPAQVHRLPRVYDRMQGRTSDSCRREPLLGEDRGEGNVPRHPAILLPGSL